MSLPRPGPLLLIRDAVPADRPPFAIRHLSFAICLLPSAIRQAPMRTHRLSSASSANLDPAGGSAATSVPADLEGYPAGATVTVWLYDP